MKKTIGLLVLLATFSFTSNAQFWNVTEPIRLGGEVNTPAEESIPVFSTDSSKLYFVRTYDDQNKGDDLDQDIWSSIKESEGSYTQCEREKSLNNKFNNAILGMNKDGTVMYVLNTYDGKKDLEKGIAMIRKEGDGWSKPEKLDVPTLDIEGDFYGFHVSADGQVMIISYKGPGTKGEEDLYVSTKAGGSWSAPQHMGDRVNSAGFEIGPFLSATKDTLFFSSNGMGGEGDADIFYSVKQGSWTSWSKPVNLGPVINSPKFDAYFTHNGHQAYWSSNRDSELSDIYMVNILTPPAVSIACTSTDATFFGGKDGTVSSTVEGGVPPFTYAWTNNTGTTEDIASLSKGDYSVTVTDAIGQTASSSCTVGEPGPPQDIALKHYFTYNADKLTVEDGKLKDFVETIAAQIENGRESVTISVNSSASYVPTRTFKNNEELAKSRGNRIANELRDYFQAKGMLGKITVNLDSSKVQGPEYADDFENEAKYKDYQYIDLKTK